MDFNKTLAFQVPEELYNRIKEYLEREKKRTGILGMRTPASWQCGATGFWAITIETV